LCFGGKQKSSSCQKNSVGEEIKGEVQSNGHISDCKRGGVRKDKLSGGKRRNLWGSRATKKAHSQPKSPIERGQILRLSNHAKKKATIKGWFRPTKGKGVAKKRDSETKKVKEMLNPEETRHFETQVWSLRVKKLDRNFAQRPRPGGGDRRGAVYEVQLASGRTKGRSGEETEGTKSGGGKKAPQGGFAQSRGGDAETKDSCRVWGGSGKNDTEKKLSDR